MAVLFLGDNAPDGTTIGLSATADKVSFFAATPVVQPTNAAQAAVSTSVPVAISSGFGFGTSAQMITLLTLVNRLRTDLVALGLIKGS